MAPLIAVHCHQVFAAAPVVPCPVAAAVVAVVAADFAAVAAVQVVGREACVYGSFSLCGQACHIDDR